MNDYLFIFNPLYLKNSMLWIVFTLVDYDTLTDCHFGQGWRIGYTLHYTPVPYLVKKTIYPSKRACKIRNLKPPIWGQPTIFYWRLCEGHLVNGRAQRTCVSVSSEQSGSLSKLNNWSTLTSSILFKPSLSVIIFLVRQSYQYVIRRGLMLKKFKLRPYTAF